MIVFNGSRKTTVLEEITVDRLECITPEENAQRNNMWIKDPELAKLYVLKGAITKQVNKIKEANNG
jgi:hypothetical protein